MNKFFIVRNFLKRDMCAQMSKMIWTYEQTGQHRQHDPACKLSSSFYGLFNNVLYLAQHKVEEQVGEPLLPSYNYCRFYKKNEILEKHIDRPSCEISFTVTLDYEQSPWPFYVESNGKQIPIILDKGDVCIYYGHEIVHWRNQMHHQNWQTQAFFHYVKKNGNFLNHAYDNELLTKTKGL